MKPFNLLRAAAVLSVLTASSIGVAAPNKPAQPKTSTNIKADMIKACTEGFSKNKILSAADSAKFCGCNITVEGNMKMSEQWEIQSMVNAGKNPATHPAIIRSRNELTACAGQKLLDELKGKIEAAQQAAQQAAPKK